MRLVDVEQVRELVETDVEGVVGVLEALEQRGHREDHRAPGVRLAGAVGAAEV